MFASQSDYLVTVSNHLIFFFTIFTVTFTFITMKVAILWFQKEDFTSFRIYTLAKFKITEGIYLGQKDMPHPFDGLRVLIPKNVQYNSKQVSPVLQVVQVHTVTVMLVTILIDHQYSKLVTNTIGLQHPCKLHEPYLHCNLMDGLGL